MKENKLLSGVSIFGTALAICMIMVIVIVWQMRTANYSPEDYRDRMMYVSDTRASYKENESYNDCYLLASRVVKDCFYPLRLPRRWAWPIMACNAWRSGGSYGGVQVRRDLYGRGVLEYLQTFASSPVSLMARKKCKVASWMLW